MNALTWVLVGAVVFWLGAAALKARNVLPRSVKVSGPIVTVHTRRGRAFLDWIARPKRAWRAWGNFGLGATLVVIAAALLFLVLAAIAILREPPAASSAVAQPRNALAIPGVNEFLPLSVAPEILLGLAIALVVHEGGHAILCRVEDIEIESLGLFFLTVLPAGAFVEPDEESRARASRGAQSRMFAAGVTNNFAITAIAFALLFGPVVGSIGVASGAAVYGALDGSPAANADIERGDVIVRIGDRSLEANDDLERALQETDGDSVEVELRSGRTVSVERSVLVTGAVQKEWPTSIGPNATITAVNGSGVSTTSGFFDAVGNASVVTLTVEEGGETREVRTPVGAFVTVRPGGPLAAAGAEPGTDVVVARFAGEPIRSAGDLQEALADTSPGETVTVAGRAERGRVSYEVTLGDHPRGDQGFLGVSIADGVSGLSVSDFGVETFPAGRYLSLLGGSCEGCPDLGLSFVQRVYTALQLPIIGVAGSAAFPYNFAGFAGGVSNFYVVEGALASLGGFGFLLANVLFWTGWINLNLAFFNCVPTFLLDGGHILRAAVESVVARLPVERGHEIATAATGVVQAVMLGSLLLLLFGAQLLN